MRCAWATLPTCTSRGLCAYQRVNAHVQGFAYKRHSTTDTTAPKTQTTSPTTPRFSAFFAEVVCTLGTTPPQTVISPPPNGGNGVIRTTKRRRHAHVVQPPTATGVEGAGGAGGPGRDARRRRRDLTFLKSRMQFDWVKIQKGLKTLQFQRGKFDI